MSLHAQNATTIEDMPVRRFWEGDATVNPGVYAYREDAGPGGDYAGAWIYDAQTDEPVGKCDGTVGSIRRAIRSLA
jgi:hypothetical protein